VGARVYVLTPSLTGNPNVSGGASSSLVLTTGATGSSAVVLDNVAGSPGNGMYYVVTDSTGAYNLTGDYTCTQNTPVYLAAIGGTPTLTPTLPTANITGVTVGTTGTNRTFTYTTSAAHGYTTGEYVTVSGYTGAAATAYNRTGFVTAYTTTTFSILATYSATATVTGTPTATGYPGWNPSAINMTALGICPSSGNGIGFKGVINYVYTNEVSTAALAMAAGAFGTDAFHIGAATGTTVDGHYNGVYDKNALGLAFNNAGLLYNIQGGDLTTSVYGEGHIARSVTPNGNGIPPQALMDTLGNILAACVDSGNTGTTANVSATCSVLFANATSTGKACTGGTGGAPPTCTGTTVAPTDIAAAAFNIAHHPAGDPSNANFVSNLFGLSTGTVPFTPNLSSNPAPNGQPTGQPNDFTATIAFAVPSSAGGTDDLLNQPQVISIDGGAYLGDEYPATTYTEANGYYQEGIWIGNYGSQAVKLFADGGVPDYAVNLKIGSTTNNSRGVAIDTSTPQENVWIVNQGIGDLLEYSITGTAGTIYPTTTNPTGPNDQFNLPSFTTLDNNGDVFIPQIGANNLLEIGPGIFGGTSNLSYLCYFGFICGDYASANAFSTATPCLSQASNAVFDQNGVLYTYGAGSGDVCTLTIPQGTVNSTKTGFSVTNTSFEGPASFAIDKNNALWGTNFSTKSLISYKAGGATATYTGGGMSLPCSTAVDGAGNIWVGNAGTYGVSEFTSAGVALSPAAGSATLAVGGYSPQIKNTYTFADTTVFGQSGTSNCASPAIDRAGNVWVVYQGTASTLAPGVVFEILGAAAPTVTPLSYATFGGFVGTRP
jgi:hypothetical protein